MESNGKFALLIQNDAQVWHLDFIQSVNTSEYMQEYIKIQFTEKKVEHILTRSVQ